MRVATLINVDLEGAQLLTSVEVVATLTSSTNLEACTTSVLRINITLVKNSSIYLIFLLLHIIVKTFFNIIIRSKSSVMITDVVHGRLSPNAAIISSKQYTVKPSSFTA